MKHLNRITNLRNPLKPLLVLCGVSMSLFFSCSKIEPEQKIVFKQEMQEQNDTMYFIFELPKNSKTGTPIESHIHFSNEQEPFKINNIFDYEIKKPSFIKRLINKDARTYVYVKCPAKSIVNAIDVHYQVNAQ
jgi:hypothetical protein